MRRSFCDVPGCHRQIFTERLPKTAAPYAQRTVRAASALEIIGFGLGGRGDARLAEALGLAGAPAVILSVLSAIRAPTDSVGDARDDSPGADPTVLGVDDEAWRKGQSYGTILVDLERHHVIDLLADREPHTLATRLGAHPGVKFISRDRAGGYADAAARAAPGAIQIVDRFHLLRNLTDPTQHTVERPTHHSEQRKLARHERRRSHYTEMIALRAVAHQSQTYMDIRTQPKDGDAPAQSRYDFRVAARHEAGRRSGNPAQAHQTDDVWPRQLFTASTTGTCSVNLRQECATRHPNVLINKICAEPVSRDR